MDDLAFYNQRYKAVRLLITILVNVGIFRLLTRDALGLGSTQTYTHACTHTHANEHTHEHTRTHTSTHTHTHTH